MAETIQRSWDINGNVELFLDILNLYRFGTVKPSEYFGDHIRPFSDRAENSDGTPISTRSVVQFVAEYFFGDSGPLRFFEPHHIPGIQKLFSNDLDCQRRSKNLPDGGLKVGHCSGEPFAVTGGVKVVQFVVS